MPHKCTRCDSIFKEGAAIILNGCPKCGWNKFLYVRDETYIPEPAAKIKTMIDTGQISPEASKFIKEIDEMLETKDDKNDKGAKDDKPELKTEPKAKTVQKEIGERVESIRILSPGQYELNLESLLERKEIVMALKEDGTYIVNLPSVFKKKKNQV